MIQLHRSFFSATSTSVPSFALSSPSHPLSLRHFMFRALPNPPNALSQLATSRISTSAQCRFPPATSHFRSFTVKSTWFGGFGFPFAAKSTTPFSGGGVFSKGFSTRVADGKQKKRAKAFAVRGKEKDESVSDSASKEVDNLDSGRSLGDKKKGSSRAASGEEDAKTVKKKTVKKKKTSPSKKVSASNSTKEDGAAEVSRKSSKGKKKVSKKSSIESAIEEIEEVPDNSASAKDELNKKNGSSSLIEEAKPLWKFTHKPLYPPSGKSVVVVESVTKAKVIKGYLGDMYEVLPSYGHVRDLAARSGSVRPDDDFSMVWEVPSPAWTHLKSIKVALSGAENLILASDPDREGEAIAWHILEMLQQQGALHDNISVARVVFHEITEQSIKSSLQTPREIDINLVHAYLARRALDYLIGFNISPLLWRKLPGCQSAGRVQSAALSLICDREMEIDEFKPREYWTVEVQLKKKELGSNKNLTFPAHLTHFDSKKLIQFSITSNTEARNIQSNINSADFQVVSLKKNKIRKNPPTPYITSTLQQDAANKLHFAATHTMKLAQKLYEGVELSNGVAVGLITYIRTDGLHISDEAVASIRSLIIERYGQDFASQSAPKYFKKVKNAQEAHEAIRPTDIHKLPSMLAGVLDEESLKLYTLIWSRTVSCQMEPAVIEQIQLDIGNADKSIILRSASSRVEFPGYQAVFKDIVTEAVQDKDSDGSSRDQTFVVLNSLKTGDPLHVVQIETNQHHTQPPPRYSEASLIAMLVASPLRILLSSISCGMLSCVIGCKSSWQIWGKIHSYFHPYTNVKDRQLRTEFCSTVLENLTVSEFLPRSQALVDDYLKNINLLFCILAVNLIFSPLMKLRLSLRIKGILKKFRRKLLHQLTSLKATHPCLCCLQLRVLQPSNSNDDKHALAGHTGRGGCGAAVDILKFNVMNVTSMGTKLLFSFIALKTTLILLYLFAFFELSYLLLMEFLTWINAQFVFLGPYQFMLLPHAFGSQHFHQDFLSCPQIFSTLLRPCSPARCLLVLLLGTLTRATNKVLLKGQLPVILFPLLHDILDLYNESFSNNVISQVLTKFSKQWLKSSFSYLSKLFRLIGGGEYQPFTAYLAQLGILHRLSCPHTHHQNGVVEHKHRHIMELGFTLLKASLHSSSGTMPSPAYISSTKCLPLFSLTFVTQDYLLNCLTTIFSKCLGVHASLTLQQA
ncbi:topA, partial [Mucuna pruriens]